MSSDFELKHLNKMNEDNNISNSINFNMYNIQKHIRLFIIVIMGVATLAIQIMLITGYISAMRDGHINSTEKEALERINTLLLTTPSNEFSHILKSIKYINNDGAEIIPRIKQVPRGIEEREGEAEGKAKNEAESEAKNEAESEAKNAEEGKAENAEEKDNTKTQAYYIQPHSGNISQITG